MSFTDTELEFPYQLRINDGGWSPLHFHNYGEALEEFHAQINELPLCQVTLWMRSENRREWHLISLANPWNEEPHCANWCGLCRALDRGEDPWGKRHELAKPQPWVNLFAGRTLAPMFFLTRGTRDLLGRLRWPAPDDAVAWRYSTETPDGTVVVEDVEITLPPEIDPEVPDTIDYAALAADPACRVDAATLERRSRMGWDLERAMYTPMVGPALGEKAEWYWQKVSGSTAPRRRYLPKI